MSQLSIESSKLALVACFTMAAILSYCVWLPPNPPPTGPDHTLPKDTLANNQRAVQGRRILCISLWALHIILTLSPSSLVCPSPDNVSHHLLTWSPFTTTIIAIILIAAPIRLLAFRQLGTNFTFRLARPNALVTTGLYAFVQHPSYPSDWLVLVSNMAMLLRLDGVLGCVLPGVVVRWGMNSGIWPLVIASFGAIGLCAIWVRVRDEEEMLKSEYGREWEVYHRRTKRFIPWVF